MTMTDARYRVDMGSLLQVAAAAQVSRGVARSAIRKGHIRDSGWTVEDVVTLKVVAHIAGLPCGDEKNRPQRDSAAVMTTRGLLTGSGGEQRCLLVTDTTVHGCVTETDLRAMMTEFGGSPVLCLPVGLWSLEVGGP